jgi:hypothetical protein
MIHGRIFQAREVESQAQRMGFYPEPCISGVRLHSNCIEEFIPGVGLRSSPLKRCVRPWPLPSEMGSVKPEQGNATLNHSEGSG